MIDIRQVEDPVAMLATVEEYIQEGERLSERTKHALTDPECTPTIALRFRGQLAEAEVIMAEMVRVRRALRVQVRRKQGLA